MKHLKSLFIAFPLLLSTTSFAEELKTQEAVEVSITNTILGESYLNDILFYGVGTKTSENTHSGFGLKYDSDRYFYLFEKNDGYRKSTFIRRFDIENTFYKKLGFSLLNKKETIYGNYDYANQMTGGLSLGYGNGSDYNLEVGYIVDKLSDAGEADTTSSIFYVEAVMKEDFVFGSVDTLISFQNSRVFEENEKDYSGVLGYYPMDDVKASIKYNSLEHTVNDYNVTAGLNYSFDNLASIDSGILVPRFTASINSSKNVKTIFDYKYDIANRTLKIKDKFKELISTSSILAKLINSDEFTNRTTE